MFIVLSGEMIIVLPDEEIRVAIHKHGREATQYANAWKDPYATVQLLEPLSTIRVWWKPGGINGNWFDVDGFLAKAQYMRSQALPFGPDRKTPHFNKQAVVTLQSGSVVNVGIAGPRSGNSGGGCQIEFRSGPPPLRFAFGGHWLDAKGTA